MKIRKFEEIVAWQKAQDLAVEIFKIFGDSRDYGFKDQIWKAVVSISNNIAEGFDRRTNKEFRQFLFIARGSCSEVKSMLLLSRRIGYIENERMSKLIAVCEEIARIIMGLIKSLSY